MSISSIYGPKFHSEAYSEKIRTNIPNKLSGRPTPLNVLYIQALDDSYYHTKLHSREHFDGKVSSAEIKVKHLEGGNPKEKLERLSIVLLALRQKGKINDSTQIILSCKPGTQDGELDIGRNGHTESWKIKEVIDAIRGGKSGGQAPSSSDFKGTIHLFGHSSKEFSVDDRKAFGNVLMHESGKFNWSHHHAFMVGHIVKASRHIKSGSPEDITKQVRDAIQHYAGYPIYRISNDKVKIKYPRFQSDDVKQNDRYIAIMKSHQQPIDMLISSVERDSAKTLRKRLTTGGLNDRLRKNKNALQIHHKKRLLAALAASKTDQPEKLKILTDLGIDFKDTKPTLKKGHSLENEVIRNRNHIEPELMKVFDDLGIQTIPGDKFADFLCKKIEENNIDPYIEKFPSFHDRCKKFGEKEISEILLACMNSSNGGCAIRVLNTLGVKFSTLSNDKYKDILQDFDESKKEWITKLDRLVSGGLGQVVDLLSDKDKFLYRFLSSEKKQRDLIEVELRKRVNAGGVELKHLVLLSLSELFKKNSSNSEPLKFLLECGLNPNFQTEKGKYLLHDACLSEKPDVNLIQLLLDKGAKLIGEFDGELVPVNALMNNHGCNVEDVKKILKLLSNINPQALNYIDKEGYNLSHLAAYKMNSVFWEALIDLDPDCIKQISTESEMTPLHCAILGAIDAKKNNKYDEIKFEKILNLLLKSGADLNAQSENIARDPQNFMVSTPMEYMECLDGYENFDLKKRQEELLKQSSAMPV